MTEDARDHAANNEIIKHYLINKFVEEKKEIYSILDSITSLGFYANCNRLDSNSAVRSLKFANKSVSVDSVNPSLHLPRNESSPIF